MCPLTTLQGVGVWGTTMGKPGTSADAHSAAAARGEAALQEHYKQKGQTPPEFGVDEEDEQQQGEPDWDALCKLLPKVR
jgi:hypothetical protein